MTDTPPEDTNCTAVPAETRLIRYNRIGFKDVRHVEIGFDWTSKPFATDEATRLEQVAALTDSIPNGTAIVTFGYAHVPTLFGGGRIFHLMDIAQYSTEYVCYYRPQVFTREEISKLGMDRPETKHVYEMMRLMRSKTAIILQGCAIKPSNFIYPNGTSHVIYQPRA